MSSSYIDGLSGLKKDFQVVGGGENNKGIRFTFSNELSLFHGQVSCRLGETRFMNHADHHHSPGSDIVDAAEHFRAEMPKTAQIQR
jgi:hypothetical protein